MLSLAFLVLLVAGLAAVTVAATVLVSRLLRRPPAEH